MITLYPSQEQNARRLHKALLEYGAALDASDTGTGKTYVALETAKRLGATPFVVCPKSVISTWETAAADTGCRLLDTPVSYEKLRYGTTSYLNRPTRKKIQWNLPPGSLVIFDEAHRCSGYDTLNSRVCAMTKAYRLRALLLSATIAESPLKMRALGYLLGLHKYQDAWNWMLSVGCRKGHFGGLVLPHPARVKKIMTGIHAQIFPDRGVRLRSADMPEFPETLITAEAYTVDAPKELDAVCLRLQDLMADPDMSAMTEQLRLRQQVEHLKVPVFRSLTQDAVDEGMSVAVFVSFRLTLGELHDTFPEASILHGEMTPGKRKEMIARFQDGRTNVFISTVSAGGTGVSLHDLDGSCPRLALISPSFNAVEMHQVLGRVHRAGGKSKSIQRLVYAAGTIEEQVARRLNAKLAAMEAFNDGDLML
jgi:superfamily II DNA or RNA helicase